jgi:hypothetical protein
MVFARSGWLKSVEDRVAATSRALSQLRGIKIMGLEGWVSRHLQHLRHSEIQSSFKERRLRAIVHFLGTSFGTNEHTCISLLTSAYRLTL